MKKVYIAPKLKNTADCLEDIICTSLEYAGNAAEENVTEADAHGRYGQYEGYRSEDYDTDWNDGLW